MSSLNLKNYRTSRGVSQQELATILNITQSAYSKKETNPDSFKPSELKIIADKFGLTIDEIVGMFFL